MGSDLMCDACRDLDFQQGTWVKPFYNAANGAGGEPSTGDHEWARGPVLDMVGWDCIHLEY